MRKDGCGWDGTGFTCICGREEKFPMYVYAHWYEHLTFICPDCQKAWLMCAGVVSERDEEP